MTIRRPSRELKALLPGLSAALLWFVVISPMRADQETRLAQQSKIRRDRLKSDRAVREAEALKARVVAGLSSACRATAEPQALRQRTVAATAGLSLSPFALSVTGGPGGGAVVEAEGTRPAVMQLTRRLGDAARGGFLRSTYIREKAGRWVVSATTGVFDSIPESLLPGARPCANEADPASVEPTPEPSKGPVRPAKAGPSPLPRGSELAPPPLVAPEPTPAPPFTLVAFLTARTGTRVSVRVGDQVRVISVGDVVEGWKCLSIDRDEGAVFSSPSRGRLVLTAGR